MNDRRDDEDDDDEGSAPPTKLALLQVRRIKGTVRVFRLLRHDADVKFALIYF